MALFWKNRPRKESDPQAKSARFPEVFPDRPLAYTDFRANDGKLKVWVPVPVVEALDHLLDATNCFSRADWLRERLFEYVYGAYDLARMHELQEGLFWTPPPEPDWRDEPLYSRSPSVAPELGKSTVDILLHLPLRLREDFESLARQHGCTASAYARQVLIAGLFGRHFLPERQFLHAAPAGRNER